MINQKQLYDAFRACKQIYGVDRVHVNLIAIQLGVLAIDVITYINDNPTLVGTRFEAANSGFVKPETVNYPGIYVTSVTSIPFISTVSTPKVGETGATIVLTLSGDTFATAAGTITNFTVDAGTTGLTLSTSTKDSNTQVTLVFTGTVGVGTLSIKATATALTGTVASDTIYVDMQDPTFTQATLAGINADIATLTAIAQTAKPGTPVAPVAASAVLTLGGTLTDGDVVTVNDVTYTFKDALSTDPVMPNEVLIGADADASVTNLAAAINGDGTEGIDYSTGTEQPTDVTAVADTGADTVTCTAITAGAAGNAYPKAATGVNLDWDGEGETFTLGVNGTAGVAGAMLYDASALYVSVDVSTVAVSHWETITFDT